MMKRERSKFEQEENLPEEGSFEEYKEKVNKQMITNHRSKSPSFYSAVVRPNIPPIK